MYNHALLTLVLGRVAAAWSTTVSEYTVTQRLETNTISATQVAYMDTTYTLAAVTTVESAYTTTETQTEIVVPTWAQSGIDKVAFGVLDQFGQGLSSAPPSASLSKFQSDVDSAWNAYTSATPVPSILGQAQENIFAIATRTGDPLQNPSLLAGLDAYYHTGSDPYVAYVTSLLTSYPAIQSQYQDYLKTAASYNAPFLFSGYTIASQDLGVTSMPPFLSVVSSYLPASTGSGSSSTGSGSSSSSSSGSMVTSTSMGSTTSMTTSGTATSTGGAAATGAAQVLINAGIAAAGMAVVAMM